MGPATSNAAKIFLLTIRTALPSDLEVMLDLSARRRAAYAPHSPVFWRVATDGREKQRPFFAKQLTDTSCICLIAENDGVIDGFLIARISPAPPVYNPGGLACVIDDFALTNPADWPTVGAALEAETARRAQAAGVAILVTVCGRHDDLKRAMLHDSGAHVTSEWYARALPKSEVVIPTTE
jgi:hypothetical protein